MVDWTSPQEESDDMFATVKLNHALVGLYAWEFLLTLDFDCEVLLRRRKFRWPMLLYFSVRYLLVATLIVLVIAEDAGQILSCQRFIEFITFAGGACSAISSDILALRTIAVYNDNRYIKPILWFLIVAQWPVVIQGTTADRATHVGAGCAVTSSNDARVSAVSVYSMGLDALVLVLTAVKLLPDLYSVRRDKRRFSVITMLFVDGLIYFIVAFLINLLNVIFLFLNLNPFMAIIFTSPSAVFSTIVACRAARRLAMFEPNPEPSMTSVTSVRFLNSRAATSIPGPNAEQNLHHIGIELGNTSPSPRTECETTEDSTSLRPKEFRSTIAECGS